MLKEKLRDYLLTDRNIFNDNQELFDFIQNNIGDNETSLGDYINKLLEYNIEHDIRTLIDLDDDSRRERIEEMKKYYSDKGIPVTAFNQAMDVFIYAIDGLDEKKKEKEESERRAKEQDIADKEREKQLKIKKDHDKIKADADAKIAAANAEKKEIVDKVNSEIEKLKQELEVAKKEKEVAERVAADATNEAGKLAYENARIAKKLDESSMILKSDDSKKSRLGCLFIFTVGIVSAVVGYNWLNSDDDKQLPVNSTSISTEVKTKKQTEEKEQPKFDDADIKVVSDLSLGGLCIGDDEKKVINRKGIPDSKKNEDEYIRYYYSDMEIVLREGKVHALVSNGANVRTKRGFHEGSSMSEIVASYGKSDMSYEDGNLVIYEYPIKCDMGKGLLRYAFNKSDSRVNYISVRIPDEWVISKAEINEAHDSFIRFHEAITNHRFNEAFSLMSPERQKSDVNASQFAEGYKDTLESKVEEISLVSAEGDEVVFNYVLFAKDRVGNNNTSSQRYKGQVHMVKVNGKWCVGYAQSKRL